ncbi:stage III sporulation protein AF [Pelosinus sp. IPA-1]|uniref:stage III sporulation protein AF n=1 Tax=Pelosinus sp. IPA-1 TaxID=3029569 RepID=UPI002553274A|nr:stage III sporulation protein AF [Pelosinus sp. IPA-1]
MFTGWVKYIIFVVLFASFLELLLPSSSMQRFVRVIMGLFIMLAIMNPIISIVQNHLIPTNQIPALSTNFGNSIMNDSMNMSNDREKLSLELYKKELAQQMKILVMAIDGVADVHVNIEVNTVKNSSIVSGIESVILYIKPGLSAKDRKVAAVSKITIGEQKDKSEDPYIDLKKRISEIVTELYQIPKEKIEVKTIHP